MHLLLGNTIAKLANDIIDTPAVMAAKSHLRNQNPLVIAPSTNNGLSGNAVNIGKLLNMKNYYFVPFKQDNPISKPNSIVFDASYIIKTLEYALEGKQIQPILLQLWKFERKKEYFWGKYGKNFCDKTYCKNMMKYAIIY